MGAKESCDPGARKESRHGPSRKLARTSARNLRFPNAHDADDPLARRPVCSHVVRHKRCSAGMPSSQDRPDAQSTESSTDRCARPLARARRPLVRARAVLPRRPRNEVDVFTKCHERGLPVMLKGPTGCGKTRFIEHMARKLEPPARHDRLPRRPLGERSHRPLPHSRRRDGLGRRSADDRGATRRDLLSRRSRRGAAGHRRRHPSAHRRPAHPADREDRRAHRGGARLSARDLVQPRLPARDQGSQAEHSAALRDDRLRLSVVARPRRRSSRTRAA